MSVGFTVGLELGLWETERNQGGEIGIATARARPVSDTTTIGQRGILAVGTLLVQVQIIGERSSYGRTDLLVKPVAGSGERWVRADRVEMDLPQAITPGGN